MPAMRLLYVEDNPLDADLVRRALARDARTAGIDLEVAATLGQARDCLRTRAPYDAVLADLNLPDGHGIDLIREIREQRHAVAVIALTSQGDEAMVLSALKAGADDYLPKSDELAQRLPGTLRAALQRFRADAARHARTLRVLYAEHDLVDLDLTRRHFERHASNLQLDTVHDAAAVLARLPAGANEPCSVDVLLLDYRLTGDSGLDLLKVVRVDRALDLPVVMVTGQGSEDVAAQAMRLGATDYVVKRDNYLVGLPAALENAFHRVSAAREQAALRRSEERLALVLRGSSDASWDIGVSGGEPYLSPRLWQLLGFETAPELRSMAQLLELVPPDERAGLAQRVGEVLNGPGDDIEAELHLRHRDGHAVPVLARGFISRDDAGRAVRVSGTCTDLSERKRAEAEIRALNNSLEARVRERTAELEKAMQRAENASRAKSEFLSHMSHELRTPMNAILGFAQIIESSDPTPRQLKWAGEIRRAGNHLLQMIEDLLDLARIEVGKMAIRIETLEFEPVLAEALAIVQPLITARRLRLLQECREVDSPVAADRLRLRQVLVNLLSNAAKYNRDGGTITVRCTRQGERIRVLVADTGMGMTTDKLAGLFQPFERLGAELGKVEGTGIGLALARQLAGLMGTTIGVDSRVGIGSEFWIDIPCAAAQKPQAPVPTVGATPVGELEFDVLYVEDNLSNIAVISEFLSQHSKVRLRTAGDGPTGLSLARQKRPDVVLLDIHLPGMDGYQVLRQLRADPQLGSVAVVALSADAMPHDMQRGLAAGFDRYIAKPVDLSELLGVLEGLLRSRPAPLARP
jgi:PAS domain S-box-containing protein